MVNPNGTPGGAVMVDMAGFGVAKPPDSLCTVGIGSCIAICLHDPAARLGGMAHIMLPRNRENDLAQPARYADTGIDALVRLMAQHGSYPRGMSAKIIGGASIITPASQEAPITVGKNNVESVTALLAERGIRILARETGGAFGRNVVFHPSNGAVDVTVYSLPVTRLVL
jgi:chemotaxis protein CheD